MTEEEKARLAGWNSEDGPAPFEHGEPVAPLAEASRPEDLPQ